MTRDDASKQGTHARRRARGLVLGVGLLALIYTAGTVLAPVWTSSGGPWGGLLRLSYAPVCHQLPERSMPIGDGFQSVCARCAGLYIGGVLGLVAGAWLLVGRRAAPSPWWLAAVALPTFVDVLLPWVGLPGLPNLGRLLLAVPVGFVAALFVARGLEEIVRSRGQGPASGLGSRDNHDVDWISRRAERGSVEVVDG